MSSDHSTSDPQRGGGKVAAGRAGRTAVRSQPWCRQRPASRRIQQLAAERGQINQLSHQHPHPTSRTLRKPSSLRPKVSLLDLPPEIREMIIRQFIHSGTGPEVYVGLGSHTPQRVEELENGDMLAPRYYSLVTKVLEFGCCHRCDSPRAFEQAWKQAWRALRPFRACKVLYQEATYIFFREKEFVLGSSSYALVWLRRIGQKHSVNLVNVRLKIHAEFFITTGWLDLLGSQWVEVLKRLGRSARNLQVLRFQFDDHCDPWRLEVLIAFMRMRRFAKLRRIDLIFCRHISSPPLLDNFDHDILEAVWYATGCPVVRSLHIHPDGELEECEIHPCEHPDGSDYEWVFWTKSNWSPNLLDSFYAP